MSAVLLPTLRLGTSADDIAQAGRILRAGGLVAMPTETVYGLAAVAHDAQAVERIFMAKGRPHWDPLIVHVADRATVSSVASTMAGVPLQLAERFWPGPLTLLLPRCASLPLSVTAGRELVGVRMPAHPVAQALIHAAGAPLAAPSANRFGHVSPTTADHVLHDLHGRIDAVVDAGPCGIGVESTVIECKTEEIILYRAGGVSAAQLAAETGLPVRVYMPPDTAATPESLPSPGVGIRHYATRARIVLVHSEQELQDLLASPQNRYAGVLLPQGWHTAPHAGPVYAWSALEDASGLAASLYDGLRSLDARGPHTIFVPLPQGTDSLFAALQDRLTKAARVS